MATPSHKELHIRLNRPEVSNALDLAAARALATTLEQAATNEEVRAVLVTGEGRRFCAGGDVAAFARAADQPAYIHQLASELDASFNGSPLSTCPWSRRCTGPSPARGWH